MRKESDSGLKLTAAQLPVEKKEGKPQPSLIQNCAKALNSRAICVQYRDVPLRFILN